MVPSKNNLVVATERPPGALDDAIQQCPERECIPEFRRNRDAGLSDDSYLALSRMLANGRITGAVHTQRDRGTEGSGS